MPKIEYEKIENGKGQNTYHNIVSDAIKLLKEEGFLKITDKYFLEKDVAKKFLDELYDMFKYAVKENDKKQLLEIIEDLIFAYEYWIAYNEKKENLLDLTVKIDRMYYESINKDMEIWQNDLDALKMLKSYLKEGRKIVNLKPYKTFNEIFEITFLKIVSHVYVMLKNAQENSGAAFESLREYEPFLKYVLPHIELGDSFEKEPMQEKEGVMVKLPIIGMDNRGKVRDLIGSYLKLIRATKKISETGWSLSDLIRKHQLDDLKFEEEILKKMEVDSKLLDKWSSSIKILDILSYTLGVISFITSISIQETFQEIIPILSLLWGMRSKVIAETSCVLMIKQMLEDVKALAKDVTLKRLSVFFSLIDGVLIPNFTERGNTKYIKWSFPYIPSHWRSKHNL